MHNLFNWYVKKQNKKGESNLLTVIQRFCLRRDWSPQPLSTWVHSTHMAWGGQITLGSVYRAHLSSSGTLWIPRLNLASVLPKHFWVTAEQVTSVTGPWALPQHPIFCSPDNKSFLTLHLSCQNFRVKPEERRPPLLHVLHTTHPVHNLWVMIPLARSPAPKIVWCIGGSPGANRDGSIVSYEAF